MRSPTVRPEAPASAFRLPVQLVVDGDGRAHGRILASQRRIKMHPRKRRLPEAEALDLVMVGIEVPRPDILGQVLPAAIRSGTAMVPRSMVAATRCAAAMAPPDDTPAKIPSLAVSLAAPRMDSALLTSRLPHASTLGLELLRDEPLVERAQALHRITWQRLRGVDAGCPRGIASGVARRP